MPATKRKGADPKDGEKKQRERASASSEVDDVDEDDSAGKKYTVNELLTFIKRMEAGTKQVDLAKEEKKSQSFFSKLKGKKAELQAKAQAMSEKELAAPKMREKKPKYPLLDAALYEFFVAARAAKMVITQTLLAEKAELLAALIVKNKGLSSKDPALGELGAKLAVRRLQQLQAVASSARTAATAGESNAAVSDSNSRSATSGATSSSAAASSSSSIARGENAAAAAGETKSDASPQSPAEPNASNATEGAKGSKKEPEWVLLKDFKRSNGYITRFLGRYNIESLTLHGEADSVDPRAVIKVSLHMHDHIKMYTFSHFAACLLLSYRAGMRC
jgi:hypothetical protein